MSQRDRILDFLEYRGERGITALDALGEEGVLRLAARIADLRAAGHVIVTRPERTPNGARIARYVLIPPVQPALGL